MYTCSLFVVLFLLYVDPHLLRRRAFAQSYPNRFRSLFVLLFNFGFHSSTLTCVYVFAERWLAPCWLFCSLILVFCSCVHNRRYDHRHRGLCKSDSSVYGCRGHTEKGSRPPQRVLSCDGSPPLAQTAERMTCACHS